MPVNYDDMEDFASAVEDEGLAYHICHYVDWADITVAGVPLPPELVAAAKNVEQGMKLIEAWLP